MSHGAENEPGRHAAGSRVMLAVTGGFAVAALCLGLQLLKLRAEKVALTTERDLAEAACRIAQLELSERSIVAEGMINELGRLLREKEDISRFKVVALSAPTDPSGATAAIAVWDPSQQAGLLVGERLAASAADQVYEIWVTDAVGGAPVKCGVFRVEPGLRFAVAFRPGQPVTGAAGIQVSLEGHGGTPAPQGPLVLAGKL